MSMTDRQWEALTAPAPVSLPISLSYRHLARIAAEDHATRAAACIRKAGEEEARLTYALRHMADGAVKTNLPRITYTSSAAPLLPFPAAVPEAR